MKHVFVETNWIVDVCAPVHRAKPSARRLVELACAGDIALHVPSICFTEARSVLREPRFTKNEVALGLREFLKWSRAQGQTSESDATVVFKFFQRFEAHTKQESKVIEQRVQELSRQPGVDAFPLSEAMLIEAKNLAMHGPILQSYDQAILAAILVRADEIRATTGVTDCHFCEIDSDLLPWDGNGDPKPSLDQLYGAHRVRVHGDWEVPGDR